MQKTKSVQTAFSLSGYGYDDFGRDTLEKVYADTFHTEACLIRSQITCGTHALAIALFGNLRPGDDPGTGRKNLMIPGGSDRYPPVQRFSLQNMVLPINRYFERRRNLDYDDPRCASMKKHVLVEIQRSKGYQTRPSYLQSRSENWIAFVKGIKPDVICMVWTTATVSLSIQWSQVMSEQT